MVPGRLARVVAVCAAAGCVLVAARGCSPVPPAGLPGCLLGATCYAPDQFRVAYGISPLLDRGIDGRGQTVVLLEEPARLTASSPVTDLRQDLALFDRLFGLPAARLQEVTSLVRGASPWLAGAEEVEDAEIVHALAPAAVIRVVLFGAAAGTSAGSAVAAVAAALRLAVSQGGVISVSYGWGEHCAGPAGVTALNSALQAARDRHVTVVASSGDLGAASLPCSGAGAAAVPVKGVNLPASDPLVLAVGGTTLQASHATGAYVGETAWNTAPQPPLTPDSYASGGGFSRLFPRPAYQDGVPGAGRARGVPDVAADASWGAASTGMALAFTQREGKYAVVPASGTSAAAPLWAAVIALADQYAGHDLGLVNPAIYRIGRSPSYRTAFHDITAGTNTVEFPPKTISGYQASPGWNPVTGWGSPDARVLIPLLARYASP